MATQLAPDLDIVDALPYVDREYEARKAEVDLLVEQEMGQMQARDYLEPLGPVHEPFLNNERLRAEYERVAAGKAMPALDMSRYTLPGPPANRQKNAAEWRQAVAAAEAQLEQEEVRLLNLELLNKYGANVWVHENETAEATRKRTELALAAFQQETTRVNQARKEEQLSAGAALHKLKMQWYELVAKNRFIAADCAQLEALLAAKGPRISPAEANGSTAAEKNDSDDSAPAPAPDSDGDVAIGEAEPQQSSGEIQSEAESTPVTEATPVTEFPAAAAGDAEEVETGETEGEADTEMEESNYEEKAEEVRAHVKGLLVKHLKKELQDRGLSYSGRKAELADRLLEAMLADLKKN